MVAMKAYFDEALETMSPDERHRYYSEKIKEIVHYAYENSPFIKRHLDDAYIKTDAINCPEDLKKIPVIKKEDVRDAHRLSPPFGDVIAVQPEQLQRIYMSPGPIYDPEHKGELRLKESKALFGAGLRPHDRVIVTFSYHLVPAGLLFDTALRGLNATVVPAGVGNTELQVGLMRDLNVTGYIGTATFLLNLINKAEELGCPFGKDVLLKSAVLTGEKVPKSLRKTFEKKYGIKTGQVYGTAEIGLFAYECSEHSGMHICEEVFVEIVDPKTGCNVTLGEVGEIVVTFFDHTLPLIRFGTGDLSYMQVEPCPCGRTSFRLAEIVGRVGDSFKVRGMFLHEPQVKAVLKKVKGISTGVLIVTRKNQRDQLTVKVELDDKNVNKDEVKQVLEKDFRDACRLKIDHIEFFPLGTIDTEEKALVDERTWD
jgi:phenylacetate-CoA ligase